MEREPACLFLLAFNLVVQGTAKTFQKHQLDLHVVFVCLKRKVVGVFNQIESYCRSTEFGS